MVGAREGDAVVGGRCEQLKGGGGAREEEGVRTLCGREQVRAAEIKCQGFDYFYLTWRVVNLLILPTVHNG